MKILSLVCQIISVCRSVPAQAPTYFRANETTFHDDLHEYLSTWFPLLQASEAASFKSAAEGKDSTPVSGVGSCCKSPVMMHNWKWNPPNNEYKDNKQPPEIDDKGVS